MENLGINVGQILAQIVNFFVLFFIFNKFVYKRIIKILDERKERIDTSMKMATETDAKAESLLLENVKKEQALTLEAHKLKQQMVKEAEKESSEIIKKAQKEATNLKSKALADAKAYLEHAHKDHDKELAKQALDISKKAVSKLLSEKSQKEITEKKIRELLSS